MRSWLLPAFASIEFGSRMPGSLPSARSVEPMSTTESVLLLGALVVAFWLGIRFVAWLDLKLCTRALIRDIFKDLGIGSNRRHPVLRMRRG